MIVVDTSVWIEWFRPGEGRHVAERLRGIDPLDVVIGDVVMLELLRGARSEADAQAIERRLGAFHFEEMLGREIAVDAARNYRRLRQIGITIRNSADLMIGTFCISRGYALLQHDRDFLPMAEHLGLRLA